MLLCGSQSSQTASMPTIPTGIPCFLPSTAFTQPSWGKKVVIALDQHTRVTDGMQLNLGAEMHTYVYSGDDSCQKPGGRGFLWHKN